jgi:hypothetical protein
VFHPAAEEEATQAAAYYEAQRAGLGREFRLEFNAAVQRIRENPQAYGVEIGVFRACPVKRFSYTLFYTELGDKVWVSAVAHQSRRPGYWIKRQP